MGLGLSALLCLSTASAFIGTAPQKTAFADDPSEDVPAEVQAVSLTTENAQLFLPDSYEQYLPLENPTDVAIGEKYAAVAQDDKIYVCNRTGDEISYAFYQHDEQISKIQYSDANVLYFSDSLLNFYELKTEGDTFSAQKMGVNASTFCIAGDTLFVAAVSNSGTTYTMSKLDTPSDYTQFNKTDFQVKPQMSYTDGKLYCVVNSFVSVYRNDPVENKYVLLTQKALYETVSVTGLKSACATGGYLYYTIANETESSLLANGIYRCDLTDFTVNPPLFSDNGFGALTTHHGYLYAIKDNSVLEYSVFGEDAALTGYEIASSSQSVNRLSGAVDTARAGDLLVTADAGNNRVSVYNFATDEYSVIPCEDAPTLVATDGKTIAVASNEKIYTCDYGDTELTSHGKKPSNIMGLACVYGNVYFVTKNAGHGRIGENDILYQDTGTPVCMTSDIYGNIYVSTDRGTVYKFTEETFLKRNQGEQLGATLPAAHSCLRADFEGNLYYLSGDKIYKNGEEFTTVNGNDFVYHTEETAATPVSFALGFEDSEVYFNFGNYIVKSNEDALEIPTLNRIVAGNAKTDTFTVHGAEKLFADVPEKTVAIRINLTDMRTGDSEYFPYEGYCRLPEGQRCVLVSETDDFYVMIVPDCLCDEDCPVCPTEFDCKAEMCHCIEHGYIVHKDESLLANKEDYWHEPEDGEVTQFYLSSNVHSYFAPSLETAMQDGNLKRGTQVNVLGYATAPDRVYALIGYTDGSNGETTRENKTGYVPKSFLTKTSPNPAENEEYLSVYLKASEDGVTFVSEDGNGEITVYERTEAKAVKNADGTYTLTIEKDGKCYVAKSVTEKQIEWKTSDAWRIALIIILSVLALVIIGAYIFLLPRNNQEKPPKKKEKAEPNSAKKE